jgi:hypothetical protein
MNGLYVEHTTCIKDNTNNKPIHTVSTNCAFVPCNFKNKFFIIGVTPMHETIKTNAVDLKYTITAESYIPVAPLPNIFPI